MSKYKRHTLYAKIEGSICEKYTVIDAVYDDRKRGQELMYGNLIEDLDRQTSYYSSQEDLLYSYPIEVYGKNIIIYDPVIIVDKDICDRSKSYLIFDIVYESDAKNLLEHDYIKMLIISHLRTNPSDIEKFRGIRDIFYNIKKKYPYKNIYDLIDMTIFTYFENENYKRYRECYFKLKKLSRNRVK